MIKTKMANPIHSHILFIDEDSEGSTGRLDEAKTRNILSKYLNDEYNIYIAGSTQFVGAVSTLVVETGFTTKNIRTERFG